MAIKDATRPEKPKHLVLPEPEVKTRPSLLRFNHGNHTYYDGKQWMPSVTGIVKRGGENQDGLMTWHADETARCAIDEAAELSRLRRLQGDDAAFQWLRNAPARHRDKATIAGSDVHDVVDRKLSGAEVPEYLHPDVLAMADQAIAFMHDYRVRVLHSEVRLANRTKGYCGTCDQLGIVPQYSARPIAIDWKTSASMYEKPQYSHGKNAMQLAPYARAEVMFWDDKTEADMIEVDPEVGLIVMIRPEGYKVYVYDLPPAWPQFERALESLHWWKATGELARPARPRREAIPSPPAPVPAGELLRQIDDAKSRDELVELRRTHLAAWTDEHTAAAKARLALEAS